jgi:hypothetical protein
MSRKMSANPSRSIESVFRWVRIAILAGGCGLFAGFFWGSRIPVLLIEMQSSASGSGQIFWDSGHGLREEESTRFHVRGGGKFETYRIRLPFGTLRSFRIDPIDQPADLQIRAVGFQSAAGNRAVDLATATFSSDLHLSDGAGRYIASGSDPYLIFPEVPPDVSSSAPRFGWLSFILVTVALGAGLGAWEARIAAYLTSRGRAMVILYAIAVLTAIVVSGGTAQLPSDGAWFRDYFSKSIHELPGIRAILTPVLLALTGDNIERFIALQVALAACTPLLVFLALDSVCERWAAFCWSLLAAIFLEWHAFSEIVLSESISVGLVAAMIGLGLSGARRPTLGKRLALAACFFLLPLAQFRLVVMIVPVAGLLLLAGSLRGRPTVALRQFGAPLLLALGLGIFANYFASYLIIGRFVSFTTYGMTNHALGMAARSPAILEPGVRAGDPAARALQETVNESPGAAVTIQVQTAIGKLSRAEGISQDIAASRLNHFGRNLALLHPSLYLSDAAEVARQYLFRQPWMVWTYYESQSLRLGGHALPLAQIDESQKRMVVVLAALGLVVFLVRWRWLGAAELQAGAVLFLTAIIVIDLGVSCLLEYSNYEHARYWITASPAYLVLAAIGLTPGGRAADTRGGVT